MKVLIIFLIYFTAVSIALEDEVGSLVDKDVKASLSCKFGKDFACKVRCIILEKKYEGHCDADDNCICKARPGSQTDLTTEASLEPDVRGRTCKFGKDLACKIRCLLSQKTFDGHCDAEDNCICKPRPGPQTDLTTEASIEPDVRGNTCKFGKDFACKVKCFIFEKNFEGHCDADDNCICKPRPGSQTTVVSF